MDTEELEWTLEAVGRLAALMSRLPAASGYTPLAVASDALALARACRKVRMGDKRATRQAKKVAKKYGLALVLCTQNSPFAVGVRAPRGEGYKSQGGHVLPLA